VTDGGRALDSDGLLYSDDRQGYLTQYRDDLSSTVGRLTQAAIDAFVLTQGYSKTPDGQGYCWQADPLTFTRPDSNGIGGGIYTTAIDRDDPNTDYMRWLTEFDGIRRRINTLVDPWLKLPDPRWIAEVSGAFEAVANDLAESGNVASLVGTLQASCNNDVLAGRTMNAFRGKFVDQLTKVRNGHSGVAGMVAYYLNAQKGMWDATRANFVELLEASTTAFKAIAKNPNHAADFEVLTRVLQYAVSVANATNAKGAIGLAKDTLGLITFATSERSKPISGKPRTFEDGMATLKSAVDTLGEAVLNTESRIRENVAETICKIGDTGESSRHAMPNNRENYDLSLAQIYEFVIDDQPRIGMHREAMCAITNIDMPPIWERLDFLVGMTRDWDEEISLAVQRPASIGLGTYGPSWMLRELNELLHDLLGDLARDVEEGSSQLMAAFEFQVSHDSTTAAELAAMNQAVTEDNGYHPWDRYDKGPIPDDEEFERLRKSMEGPAS